MNAPEKEMFLPDVQSSGDSRNVAIQRVGVKDLTYPVTIATARGPQPSVASVDMYVALPPTQKGTHMSRFIEVLRDQRSPLSPAALRLMLANMLQRLDASEGSIALRFPYFISKTAPVSGVEGLMDYRVVLTAERRAGQTVVWQTITAPDTSLCPCSKKVADYGAHDHRSGTGRRDDAR
jgi:GTP cyclohydrolase I